MKCHVILLAIDDVEVSEDVKVEFKRLGILLNHMFPDSVIMYKHFEANLNDLTASQPLITDLSSPSTPRRKK